MNEEFWGVVHFVVEVGVGVATRRRPPGTVTIAGDSCAFKDSGGSQNGLSRAPDVGEPRTTSSARLPNPNLAGKQGGAWATVG